ncbi:class I SAM-dependent methyltransferase [Streptomyces scopuliridis]|uniref:class I SAM-dependent methyltransferase n=1 Tax=Streptomyces scopuliridis TaxID=452529 RepID=UPI002DD85590|nr:class I SAM-dependent methyltransferase [Streptomyces scopuliridis]WSB33865.1 class I SAM-dependent methyltransferase [Streptomyces scopuliridis]
MTTANEDKPRPRELNDVRGWFPPLDQVLFEKLLTRQEERGERGDLLELGVFMGKSAIFLGHHLRDGEKFTVCDLFESEAPDQANGAETAKSYATLTREAFERNYLSFHDELPRVLQAPSSVVADEVEAKSSRFVHIDASHLYEHVYGDIGAARDILLPGGIVVLDDFRSEHTPGVSIAAWEAVLNRGLRPICLSTQKLYATWDDPEPIQDELIAMAQEREDCDLSIQQAAGHRIVRLRSRGMKAPDFPFSKYYEEPKPEEPVAPVAPPVASAPAPAAPRRRSTRSKVRRVAIDVLPPVITRAVQRSRARRRAQLQG